MKFRLLTLFLGAFFILFLGNIASASEKTNSTVNKFETLQLSNEALYTKALQGELINNKHTQVIVTENKEEGTKTIDINKILSEEILPNGDVITKNANESTILIAGSLTETRTPGSSSVGLRIRMDFDAQRFGGYDTRKLTKYTLTPLRFDSQFSMTYFEHQAGTWGAGWKSNGQRHVDTQKTALYKVTSIGYNSQYIYNPNFVKYTPINTDAIAGTGVSGKFKYRRGTSGAILTHSFTMGW